MKLKIYLGYVIVLITVASCSTNKSADPDFKYDRIQATQINENRIVKEISQITLPPTKVAQVNNNSAPVINQPQTPVVATPPNSNINAANNPLNPAHGQAGHRCDIAVGAPLNSKPGPALQNQPAIVPAAAKINSGPANKSLNPAHGQPGHRCDIAVGAPLNSKPATAATQNVQTVVRTSSPESASRWGGTNTVAQNKTGKTTTPGMNPSHGEPGHRCDIPVGSSLSQAIVKTDNPVISNSSIPIKDSAKK